MQSARVGILGCGQIALSTHLPNLRRMAGVQVVALAELDAGLLQRAQALAPGAKAFRDWRDIVALPDVDAIVVALPTGLHAEAALAVGTAVGLLADLLLIPRWGPVGASIGLLVSAVCQALMLGATLLSMLREPISDIGRPTAYVATT